MTVVLNFVDVDRAGVLVPVRFAKGEIETLKMSSIKFLTSHCRRQNATFALLENKNKTFALPFLHV